MQYLKKSRVNSRARVGRSIIVETSFEETARKYRRAFIILPNHSHHEINLQRKRSKRRRVGKAKQQVA
jgi:hypothetical protein